jgi:hypothetical protein
LFLCLRSPCDYYLYFSFLSGRTAIFTLFLIFSGRPAIFTFIFYFSQVALRFRQAGKREACQVGATIPYIICREKDSLPQNGAVAERARHIDEITPDGAWQPDIDYYLSQQVRTLRDSGLEEIRFGQCRV